MVPSDLLLSSSTFPPTPVREPPSWMLGISLFYLWFYLSPLNFTYCSLFETLHTCTKIQPVHSKGDQPWVFFGRTDAKAETPILWPPHAKSWFIGKDSDAGRDWGPEEKGTTEDEMAGWHHWLNGRESGWTPGVGDGQGGLACCDSWGCKESDMTEWLNWTELNCSVFFYPISFSWEIYFAIVAKCNHSSWILVLHSLMTRRDGIGGGG